MKSACPIPRARGGVSLRQSYEPLMHELFPACAGVFPYYLRYQNDRKTIPRVRGGVSNADFKAIKIRFYSPRTLGCF